MDQVSEARTRSVWRALVLLALAGVLLLASSAGAAATDDPSSGTDVVQEGSGGFSLLTSAKQVAIIAIAPLTLVGMAYGARRLRGEPKRTKRRASHDGPKAVRAKSRPTMAPPPNRTKTRSAMKQVGRLKKK